MHLSRSLMISTADGLRFCHLGMQLDPHARWPASDNGSSSTVRVLHGGPLSPPAACAFFFPIYP